MSTNSNILLFLLVALQTVLSTGLTTASTTLLITGHSSNNIYKYAFAQKFASQVELDRAHSADIVVISSDLVNSNNQEQDGVLLRTLGGVPLTGNFSQVVISRLGGDEMSLDHIQVLFGFIDTDEPLIAVEIGEQSVQTRALLNKGAVCWGEARADFLSPNKAFLCNDISPETVKKVVDVDTIHTLADEVKIVMRESTSRTFWPCLFASAAKTERKNRKKEAQEEIEVEDDVEEIVDRVMENIENKAPKHKKIEGPVDKKLNCKYRKSCYENGKLPEIDDSGFSWDSVSSWFSSEPGVKEDNEQDENDNDDSSEEDLTPKKLKCKYRLDCYKEKGIKLTGKDEEREERKSLLAGKIGPQQGKKRTLKEIAEKTVKKVKVAEEKAAARPLPVSVIAERKLNEIEEKLTEKLQCKYRKSCYETGEPPVIESTWSLPVFSTHSAEEAAEQVDFQEMEDLEKKMFCKYRKSCYDTGVKPEIESDIQIHSFSDLRELPDVIETRKMTIQEKCKYRKSCYETGILPELNAPLETVVQKEVSSVIPTNMDELKKFCKYRKSCYEEIAESASVETVKNIRKRRMVEKEVRRRKVKRARMRRRLRGVELGDITTQTSRSKTKAEGAREEQSVEREPERITEPPQKAAAKGKKSIKTKEAVKEEPELVAEPPVPVTAKHTKKRGSKVVETVQEEPEVEQPLKVKKVKEQKEEPKLEPVTEEPAPEQQKQKKKGKKVAEPAHEPEPEKEKEPELEKPKAKSAKKSGRKEEAKLEEKETKESVKETKKNKVADEPVQVTIQKEKKHIKVELKSEREKDGLSYSEEKKLQMHCKYRKSCYETKERPVIHQTFSTLYDKFDSHVNEHYESLENKELSEADKKLACKYRKTCYETNQRPIIVQTLSSIWGGKVIEKENDDDDDEEEEIDLQKVHNEHEKKLVCKYRKSCYETNKKPVIVQTVSSIWGGSVATLETVADDNDAEEGNWHKEEHQKLSCKYRKSCYDKKGLKLEKDDKDNRKEEVKLVEKEQKEPPKNKESKAKAESKKESKGKVEPKVVVKESKKEIKVEPKLVVKKEESVKKEEPVKKEKHLKKQDTSDEEDEDEEEKKTEVKDEDLPQLERGQKLGCKYRKSCYVNAPPLGTPTRTIQVEGGAVKRVKCNEYYLSCREQMGLPPKVKAPIGPNGRKLCRRKKIDK